MELVGAAVAGFPKLHHYQEFNAKRLRDIIEGKRLYFSNPVDFNDPWDCVVDFDRAALSDPKRYKEHIQGYLDWTRMHAPCIPESQVQQTAQRFIDDPVHFQAKIDEVRDALTKDISERYRIYCLSIKDNSELMWAHYGGKHTGVCLEFSSHNALFSKALKVRYQKVYSTYDLVNADVNVLLTKSDAWAYEDEYRIVAHERTFGTPEHVTIAENNFCELPDGCLQAIITGCLADVATISEVEKIVRSSTYPIGLKCSVKSPNAYKLLTVPVRIVAN